MDKAKKTAKLIADGKMNCARAVITAYCVELSLPGNTALRLAGGFGGGMGHSDNTCGAVVGAVMVIGLRQYPGIKDGRQRLERVYSQARDS